MSANYGRFSRSVLAERRHRRLSKEAKLLRYHLTISASNAAGYFVCPLDELALQTSMTEAEVITALHELEKAELVGFDENTEAVLLRDWFFHNPKLSSSKNAIHVAQLFVERDTPQCVPRLDRLWLEIALPVLRLWKDNPNVAKQIAQLEAAARNLATTPDASMDASMDARMGARIEASMYASMHAITSDQNTAQHPSSVSSSLRSSDTSSGESDARARKKSKPPGRNRAAELVASLQTDMAKKTPEQAASKRAAKSAPATRERDRIAVVKPLPTGKTAEPQDALAQHLLEVRAAKPPKTRPGNAATIHVKAWSGLGKELCENRISYSKDVSPWLKANRLNPDDEQLVAAAMAKVRESPDWRHEHAAAARG